MKMNMKTCLTYSLRLGLLVAAYSPNLLAQEQPLGGETPDESFAAEADALESGATMFPIPQYEGDVLTREALLGDWGGARTTLAEKYGMQFAVDVNQYYQGIWDGGRSRDSDYNGSTDYRFKFDYREGGAVAGRVSRGARGNLLGSVDQWVYRRRPAGQQRFGAE